MESRDKCLSNPSPIGGCREMRIRLKTGVSLFFDVEGAKLEAHGSVMRNKPTLILLHGGPGFDHAQMKPEYSPLATQAQLIYIDHRGHGRSDDGDPDQWSLERWGDDILDFCEALEIVDPIVLGLSFGGFIAQAYATRHPEHPRALILSSTSARLSRERIYAAFESLGGTEARRVAEQFWGGNSSGSAMEEYLRVCLPLYRRLRAEKGDRRARQIFRAAPVSKFGGPRGESMSFNFLPVLHELRCPTLVIAGAADPVTTIADAREMAAAIREDLRRLVVVPGAGHPVIWDDPEAELRAIDRFLREIRSGTVSGAH